MTIVCNNDKCPWRITCPSMGEFDAVQVYTFNKCHNHSLDDAASSQPTIRANRSSMIMDEVIRSTLDYLPRQTCKDFIRQNGMRLSYGQAWYLREKAKE